MKIFSMEKVNILKIWKINCEGKKYKHFKGYLLKIELELSEMEQSEREALFKWIKI